MYIRTDGKKESVDRDGITPFWVMRSLKDEGLMPADAPIGKELGNTFANLVAGEGAELAKWLLSSAVVQESGPKKILDVEKMRYYFKAHEGHLPEACWPRYRRNGRSAFPPRVCTCTYLIMHGDCEHLLFVRALTDPDAAQEMEKVPVIRKKGRKRKAAATKKHPKAHARKKIQGTEPCMAAMGRGQEAARLRPHTSD